MRLSLKHILPVILTTTLTSVAYADVTLMVDENIKVTGINGQPVNQSLFQPLQKKFILKPGKHIITAKYDRLFEFSNNKHDYLRSANISVSGDLQDNQTYYLTMPNQPDNYQDAKKYARQPTLAIEQNQKIISEQQALSSQSSGLFSGVSNKISGLFGQNTQTQPSQQPISPIESSAPQPKSQANPDQSTLDKFMQIWLQATPAEREKIRQWIEQ